MEEDKKKLLLVASVGGVAIVGFLVFAFTVILGDKKPTEVIQNVSARPAVPDAVEEKLFSDKDKAYASAYSKEGQDGGLGIEDIWSSLASKDDAGVESGSKTVGLSESVFGIDSEGHVIDDRPESQSSSSQSRGKRTSSSGSKSTASSELIVSKSSSSQPKSSSTASSSVKKSSSPKATEKTSEPGSASAVATAEDVTSYKGTKPQRTTGWNNSTSGVISSLSDEDTGFEDSWENVTDERFVRCCFAKDYTIKSGSRVTVRLLENLYLDELVIPANTRITAMCSISDRVNLSITGLELNGKMYNVNYMAFDIQDGKQGIYCSNANDTNTKRVKREALHQGASAAREVLSYGGAIGSLASDAIGIAQSIGNSEIAITEVSLPAGFEFYIKKSKR